MKCPFTNGPVDPSCRDARTARELGKASMRALLAEPFNDTAAQLYKQAMLVDEAHEQATGWSYHPSMKDRPGSLFFKASTEDGPHLTDMIAATPDAQRAKELAQQVQTKQAEIYKLTENPPDEPVTASNHDLHIEQHNLIIELLSSDLEVLQDMVSKHSQNTGWEYLVNKNSPDLWVRRVIFQDSPLRQD